MMTVTVMLTMTMMMVMMILMDIMMMVITMTGNDKCTVSQRAVGVNVIKVSPIKECNLRVVSTK